VSGSAWASVATPEIIRTGTQFGPVPLVPEIRLRQAAEPIGLWQRIEQAAGRADLDPPFWAFAWAGGQALARYLLDHPQVVRGRRVIDVASGSGLVAIAAAKAGAAAVTAYDIDPLAAAAIEVNAAANAAASVAANAAASAAAVVAVVAVCADILDEDGMPASGTDLVLVADAFYTRDLAAKMMRFLQRAAASGADVLIGDFGRAYLPRTRLTPLASYDVTGLRALEDSDSKHTTVWSLSGRPAEDGAAEGRPA